jgi:L-malate glycosyltransferase
MENAERRKLRIGIVLYPTFGGSGVLATELGRALASKGHEVHFIASSPPARMDSITENVFFHEVHIPSYPLFEFAPYEVALTSTIVHVATYAQLDLIHAHYAIPHASAAVMARAILAEKGKRVPVVTTLHGTDITLVGKDRSYQPVISYAINQSDAVTAVSEYLKEETIRHFEVHRPIEVIYNFINPEEFDEKPDDCLKKYAAPKGEFIVTHVSNFRPVKRVLDVVRTFALIHEQMPSKLLMVGDGPDRQAAEELARDLGVASDVLFVGKAKNTLSVLPCSDLFLLPSASESFGLSALEAMACGVPVIATRSGGMPEVQTDGVTGFLTEVGDYQAMAKGALQLLQSPEMHASFGEAAKRKAQDFSVNRILPQYEVMYHRLVKG